MSPAASDTSQPRAILTPGIDLLCVGGASAIALALVLILRVPVDQPMTGTLLLTLQVLINYPHFMASYRLLYQRREMVQRYKWAAIYLPALLLAYVAFAFFYAMAVTPDIDPRYYFIVDYLASSYLAVHYTGQAWGMVASFGYLTGSPPTPVERRVLRAVLYVFLGWHIATYHHHVPLYAVFLPFLRPLVPYAYVAFSYAAHAAMAAAVVTFIQMSRRVGRPVSPRMVLPVVALYLGYVNYQRGHIGGLLLLQLGHALQYLIFPLRVELNVGDNGRSAAERMLSYFGPLLITGWLAFVVTGHLQPDPWAFAGMVFVGAVNVHHYFIDGCVWKISNPDVRRDLFRHLAPAPGAKAGVAPRGAVVGSTGRRKARSDTG